VSLSKCDSHTDEAWGEEFHLVYFNEDQNGILGLAARVGMLQYFGSIVRSDRLELSLLLHHYPAFYIGDDALMPVMP
jgi:hypothetical protein